MAYELSRILIAAEHLVKTTLMLPADAALMKTLNPLGKVAQDSMESTGPPSPSVAVRSRNDRTNVWKRECFN